MAKRGRKKRRSKKKGHSPFAAAAASASGRHHRGRHPTAKAKAAYYANVRKAYRRLKPIAEKHGFA